MSEFSFMEKLLDGVEVERQPLEQVAKIKHGKDWKSLNAGDVPVYGSGGIMGYVDTYSYDKPTVLIPRKGSITNIFYVNSPFWNVDTIFYTEIDESKIIPKFLYYFIKTIDLLALDTGAGRPSLTQAILNKIQIPIPCPENPEKSLEIQTEIARILDTFTELTAELNTELTVRKKQYNYYRDQLLSFEEEEVEWKTLEDVCSSISAGGDVPKKSAKGQMHPTDEFPYPIFANAVGDKGLYGYSDEYKIESDAVTISARGAKIGYHTIREGKFTPIIRLITLVPNKESVTTRFLNYILNMTPINGSDGGIPQLTVPTVKKITVPIPYANDPEKSLAEQARIVAILDKFDALTNSITEGLPREISLRQKQYEYYRDLLLSFPKPEEAAA
jgi:type I restriction enzyme S subunit